MKKLRNIIPTTNHMPVQPRIKATPILRFNTSTAAPMHKTRNSGLGLAVQYRNSSTLRAAMTDLYRPAKTPLNRFGGMMRRGEGSIEDHVLHPSNLTMGKQRAMMSIPRVPKFAKHRVVW